MNFSMYSLMSSWMSALESPNICSASVLASSVLPTPVGPSNAKRADGPARVLQIGARAAQGLADGDDGFVLADDDFSHLAFDGEQSLHFVLLHALERDAGPLGDDVQDVLLVHDDALFFARGAPVVEQGLQFFLRLLFLVAHRGGAFEVLLLDGAFLLAS